MRQGTGHVPQTALRRSLSVNENYQATALIEGVVVAVHYPEDTTNTSKVQVEYDVDPTSVFGMGRLRNVPRVDVLSGLDDGDDNILRVAAETWDGASFVPDGGSGQGSAEEPTARYETSGDRVLIGFVNGNAHRPVILGVLTHFFTRRTLDDVTGKALPREGKLFRRHRHRGTELVLDDKGNVTVNFGKTPDALGKDTDDKKTFTMNIGDFEIRIDNSASPTTCEFKKKGGAAIVSFTKDGFEVGPSGESMVLGDTLEKLLNDFMEAYNMHQHTGNFGAPTPLIPDKVTALKSQVSGIKSDWAKVSKAKP
jgi:hypothetical protein